MYTFLPQLPLSASPLALFGLLLVAGVIGGELVRRVLKLPRIVGYVVTGMLLGASGLGLVGEKLLAEAWIFVDIALGLVLYELGLRLDFSWLKRDRWLLATGLAESALSFAFIYFALAYFGVGSLHAAVAAAIGVATSPAVVMLVAQELRAEGQVTERALNLTAINSVVSFVLVTMLLSWIHHEYRAETGCSPSCTRSICSRGRCSSATRRSSRRFPSRAGWAGRRSASSCWCLRSSSPPSGPRACSSCRC